MASSASSDIPTNDSSLAAFGKASPTQARATLLSILTYYAPGDVHKARAAPEGQVATLLANAIESHGLSDATSWGITGGKATSISDRAPAKAGPDTSDASWAETFDQWGCAARLANPFGIPRDITDGLEAASYWGACTAEAAKCLVCGRCTNASHGIITVIMVAVATPREPPCYW